MTLPDGPCKASKFDSHLRPSLQSAISFLPVLMPFFDPSSHFNCPIAPSPLDSSGVVGGAIYLWVKVYSGDGRVTAGERRWDDKQRTMYITGRLYIVSITVNTPPSLPIPRFPPCSSSLVPNKYLSTLRLPLLHTVKRNDVSCRMHRLTHH